MDNYFEDVNRMIAFWQKCSDDLVRQGFPRPTGSLKDTCPKCGEIRKCSCSSCRPKNEAAPGYYTTDTVSGTVCGSCGFLAPPELWLDWEMACQNAHILEPSKVDTSWIKDALADMEEYFRTATAEQLKQDLEDLGL